MNVSKSDAQVWVRGQLGAKIWFVRYKDVDSYVAQAAGMNNSIFGGFPNIIPTAQTVTQLHTNSLMIWKQLQICRLFWSLCLVLLPIVQAAIIINW